MKVAYSSSKGFSFSAGQSKIRIDPTSTKSLDGEGILFTAPHTKEVRAITEKNKDKNSIFQGAGEYEMGNMLAHSTYVTKNPPLTLMHRISYGGIHTLFIGKESLKEAVKKEDIDTETINTVVIAYEKGICSPQEAYSCAFSLSPQVILFFDTDGTGKETFIKIGGAVEEVDGSYTIKKRDIEEERTTIVVVS